MLASQKSDLQCATIVYPANGEYSFLCIPKLKKKTQRMISKHKMFILKKKTFQIPKAFSTAKLTWYQVRCFHYF